MKMPSLFKMPFLHVAAGAGRLFTGQMDMPEAAPRRMKMYRKPPACRVAQGERNPADCGTGPFSGQAFAQQRASAWLQAEPVEASSNGDFELIAGF
jgi:hypothetical protein